MRYKHEGKLRNTPCHCGSGKKYKKCHMRIDEGFVKKSDVWVCAHLSTYNRINDKLQVTKLCTNCSEPIESFNSVAEFNEKYFPKPKEVSPNA